MAEVNTTFIDNYLGLIKNLSPEIKIDIIEKLMKSLKHDFKGSNKTLKDSFGAWKSEKSADEIISELRNSRTFKREIESL
jgi:phosphoheptose isomerase